MEKGGPNFWVRISTQLPWSCVKLLYLVECRCKIHLVSGLKIRIVVIIIWEVFKTSPEIGPSRCARNIL